MDLIQVIYCPIVILDFRLVLLWIDFRVPSVDDRAQIGIVLYASMYVYVV